MKNQSLGVGLISTNLYALVLVPLLFTALIPILGQAFAQEPKYVNRTVLAWNLFYKLMTVAFIVGAIVQGFLVFIIIRFREKKVKPEEVES